MILDLISARLLSVAVAVALVCGGLWIGRAWRRRRGGRTLPEAAAAACLNLGRRLILWGEFADSVIICWRNTMREYRPIRTRSEVDRELRKLGRTMEMWRS